MSPPLPAGVPPDEQADVRADERAGERAGERDREARGGGAAAVAPPAAWRLRRVLVALDASPSSRAAATAAAAVAAALQAELAGLFVEDARISRLAGLPAALEVGSYAAAARPLSGGDLDRRLRAQAERARHLFEAGARRVAVRGTFRVVRGDVAHEVATAGGATDLLSLGRVGVSAVSRLGSVARAALARGRGPLLLLPAAGRLAAPLVAVYAGGAAGRHLLAVAARLPIHHPARHGDRRPVVLLPAADAATASRLRDEAAAVARALGLVPRFRAVRLRHGAPSAADARPGRCHPADRHALAHAIAEERAATLLLPSASPLASAADVEAVVRALDCALLLVR